MESGELSIDSPRCKRVTWKISNFFQLSREERYFVVSPGFYFAGLCFLRLFPNMNNKVSVISNSKNFSYNLMFQTSSGEEIHFYRYLHSSLKHHNLEPFTPLFYIRRQELEANKDSYVPNGILTLICYLAVKKSNAGNPDSEETDREPGVVNLQSDYRQLLQNGTDSDAFLEVSGKEFRAHRCVLRARSPVFDAMFRHQMAEKESGRVVIHDLDPDCFVHFLEYMYTGVVGAGILKNHAFGLYKAAEKYGVPTLKAACMAYMYRTLSVDSFCDVMTLALLHHEERLLQLACSFFELNLQRIIVTPKWEQFLIGNGKTANKLLVNALVPQRQ